jgi:hypothetical protein
VLAWLLLAALLATGADAQIVFGGGGGSGGFQIIGQGYPNTAITGTTTEVNVAAVKVPANSMGPNGELRVTLLLTMNNNANTKSVDVHLNPTSGAVTGGSLFQTGFPSVQSAQLQGIIRNTGATNAQTAIQSLPTPFGSGGGSTSISTDTTQDTWLNVGIWPAVGTDTITLLGYTVEVRQGE